jgi:predicted ester cyclase
MCWTKSPPARLPEPRGTGSGRPGDSFPDVRMQITGLIAEGEKVAAHFRCPGTHLGECLGHPPAGRRFHDAGQIYIFWVTNGKLTGATAVKDNLARMRQLGLNK